MILSVQKLSALMIENNFSQKFIINPKIQDFFIRFFCNAPTLFRSKVLEKVKKFNESDHYKKRYEDYEFFFDAI